MQVPYHVHCPSDPYENTSTHNYDRAMDLTYRLAEEYGYAYMGYYNLNGHFQLIADYSNR